MEDRQGAPIAYVFGTYVQTVALRNRIFLCSAGDNGHHAPAPTTRP